MNRRPNISSMRTQNSSRPSPQGNISRPPMSAPNNNVNRQRNQEVEISGIYKNSQSTFYLSALIGCPIEVQVNNGKRYEGIFKTFSPELEMVLECAHLMDESLINNGAKLIETFIVNFSDIVAFRALDADIKHGELDSFTDVGISRAQVNGVVKEDDLRQLTPWDDEGAGQTHLEDNSSSGWAPEEMFRSNQEKFGVVSSFDDTMEQYTTKLDKSNTPENQKRRQAADRYASEIERSSVSRQNTALENGDDVDEETRFSAVVRPTTTGGPPSKPGYSSNAPKKYTPPQMRTSQQVQFSHSARLNGRDSDPRRESSDKRNKAGSQSTTEVNLQSLRTWNKNFHLPASDANSSPSGDHKSPSKGDAVPAQQQPTGLESGQGAKSATAQPSTTKPSPQAAPGEPTVSKSEATPASSAPPQSPAAAQSSASTKPNKQEKAQTSAAESTPDTTADSTADSTADTASTADAPPPPAKTYTLNPEAFAFVPKAAPVVPSRAPAPMQAPPQAHPAQHQNFHKSKTATVSVVDSRQPTRSEMPTPAQAMGPPLINSSHHPPNQQYHNQLVMLPGPHPRLQRVSSIGGNDGQPGQPHFIHQQQFIHNHQFIHNGMAGHVGIPQPVPGHQQGNMPNAPPPHNAAIHPAPPQGHQHPPPPTGAPGGQHVHPQNTPYPNHHGAAVPYMYPITQQPGGQAAQPTQPPLQASPHPSPSPVTMTGGGPVPFHNYPPPQSQQFYQPQVGPAVVSQAAPAQYSHPQQQLVYLPPIPGQYSHHPHQMPVYFSQPMQGFPQNFPQQ